MNDTSQITPPRAGKRRAIYDITSERMVVTYRYNRFLLFGCAVVWLVPWTIATVVLTYRAVETFDEYVVGAVLLWACWLLVVTACANALFGRDVLTVDSATIRYEKWILIRWKRRVIPTQQFLGARVISRLADGDTGRRDDGLELRSPGKPIKLFFGLPKEELRWLERTLSKFALSAEESSSERV